MQPRDIQSIDLNINPDWLSTYINPKFRGEILLWGKVYSIVGFSPWGKTTLQQRNYKVMNFGLSVAYYHYERLLEVRGYDMRERGLFFIIILIDFINPNSKLHTCTSLNN